MSHVCFDAGPVCISTFVSLASLSFSNDFLHSLVNNETCSRERDKRCHLMFIPHSFCTTCLDVEWGKLCRWLTDIWQHMGGWGKGEIGLNLQVALTYSSNISALYFFLPQVSRASISTAVMAVRKLIAGASEWAALQTYLLHYLSFHAPSWRALFCARPHILLRGGPAKELNFLQFVLKYLPYVTI